MGRNVSFDLIGDGKDVRGVLKGRHQTGTDLPGFILFGPFSFLFVVLTQLDVLEIPHHDLTVDGACDDDSWVFGVELKGCDLERRA